MISDVLHEAITQIRNYQQTTPAMYEGIMPEIDTVVSAMNSLLQHLDHPEPEGRPNIFPPVDMILFCPRCYEQHVDELQPEKGWDNPPHRSHECQHCGFVWRPADIATNGVREIKTRGKRDQAMS